MGNNLLCLYICLVMNQPNQAAKPLDWTSANDLMTQVYQGVEALATAVDTLSETVNSLYFGELGFPENCIEATKGRGQSGIYQIGLKNIEHETFYVACDAEEESGGWLIILRRQDGSVNFDRTWDEYKAGFGELSGEHFIGLDRLYALTSNTAQELLIVLKDFSGVRRYARYDHFSIGGECEQYPLEKLGRYSGNAGNDMADLVGFGFSTKDNDNDATTLNCAEEYTGGWWYKDCSIGHLTGKYYTEGSHQSIAAGTGINWSEFRGLQESLRYAVMMIRPRKKEQ